MFFFWEGLELASGTYLPGPTEAGVDVWFFRPPSPRLKPNVYNAALFSSGLSPGKYCGPGFCSRLLGCIWKFKSQLAVRLKTYSWLCSDLWSAGARLSVLVRIDWVVEEEGVLVEVVLRFLDLHPGR